MMYNQKMAVAIKVGGKVLRENKDQVYLPFGSEYSLFLKNLHTKRALVRIQIDGVDVTGGGLIVNANSSVDLERFINNGNLLTGNRFKFIERTAKVEAARGIEVEDGLIRVEFEFEREHVPIAWMNNSLIYRGSTGDVNAIANTWLSNSTFGTKGSLGFQDDPGGSTSFCTANSLDITFTQQVQNDVGITVPGSVSDQKFVTGSITTDGVKHVMVMKLLGETDQGTVDAPITVKMKPKCITCNHMNTALSKFCSECGTSLCIM